MAARGRHIAVSLAVALALAAPGRAQDAGLGLPLAGVNITSDAWVDRGGLIALLPLRIGEPVTAAQLAESRRILEQTRIFRRIDVDTAVVDGATQVTFQVQRRLVIAQVTASGYDALAWRAVFRVLRLRSGAFYSRQEARAARQRLLDRYARLGYPRAEIELRVTRDDGLVDLHYAIDEGEPTRIAAVVVVGDTGVPAARLQAALKDLQGEPQREDAVRDGERTLLATLREAGYYGAEVEGDWVSTDPTAGALWYTVDAGVPYQIEFVGNAAKADQQLLGLMDLRTRLIITDGTWRELARRIAQFYREWGYYRVSVTVSIEEGEPRRIVYTIDEGRPYAVRSLRFIGNEEMPAEQLREEMNTLPKRWLPWPRGGEFVPSVFDEDLRRLWFFYREEGFENAEIVDAPIEVDDASGAIGVTVVIAEGPRTIVDAVEPPDLSGLPPPLPTPALEPGAPLRPQLLAADTEAILASLRRDGYVDATVTPQVKRRPGDEVTRADVSWAVERGPRYLIGQVIVQGNVETRDRIILRQLPFEPGDPLDREALQQGQDRIYQLGTYRSVAVEPITPDAEAPLPLEADEAPALEAARSAEPPPAAAPAAADPPAEVVRDVGVEVVPRPPASVQWGLGYNTRDGATIFGELTFANVAHSARRVILRGQGSVRPDDLESAQYVTLLGFRDQQFLGSRWAYNAELIAERSTESINQYDIERYSLGNGLTRQLRPRLLFTGELQVTRADVFNVEPIAFLEVDEGVSYTTSLAPSLTYDGRNDPFAPTRGVFDTLRLRYAPPGISSTQLGTVNAQHSQAIPLFERLAFIYSLRAAYGRALSGDPVMPIRERFFIGGSTTVRGFSENSIGPTSPTAASTPSNPSRAVLGGDLALIANLEWRVPIIYQLSLAAFTDVGGLFLTQCDRDCEQARDVQDNDFTWRNFRRSAGPGLRYMTPVGPLSLDYGFKLDRRSGESIGEVHFSISGTF